MINDVKLSLSILRGHGGLGRAVMFFLFCSSHILLYTSVALRECQIHVYFRFCLVGPTWPLNFLCSVLSKKGV